MAPKINIKERINDGELDLAMSELQEVPVRDIAQFPKVINLDLSNNHLQLLPKQFVTLTHLIKLDLSKNKLTELPEDFGHLSKLKCLDLYSNKLNHLPLSFGNLKSLKFLDLKDNPLMPAVAKIVGPCLDTQQCNQSAKNAVAFYSQMQASVEEEKEKREAQRQKSKETTNHKQQKQPKVIKSTKKLQEKIVKHMKQSTDRKEEEKKKVETIEKVQQLTDKPYPRCLIWLTVLSSIVLLCFTLIFVFWKSDFMQPIVMHLKGHDYDKWRVDFGNKVKQTVMQVYKAILTMYTADK